MDEDYNIYCFNHIANAEKVINNQIEELKTEISCLISEMKKESYGSTELDFTKDRASELNYQINKLNAQLERLTKENEN